VQDTFNGTPFMVVAAIYLVLTVSLTQTARWLERRGNRAR
jgi:ABC-type amino acid transport system permease subunit